MKALILAAGRGSRLLPMTDSRPKCLLSITADTTIFDIQMQALKRCGVYEVVIVTGHVASTLEEHARTQHPDMQFTFLHNDRYLETGPAYSFWYARDVLNEPILYLNSDVLFDEQVLQKILSCPAASATAITKSVWDEEEVNVVLDDRNNVQQIGKAISEEQNDGEFVGITKLSPSFIHAMVAAAEKFNSNNELSHFAADAIHGAITSGEELRAVDITGTNVMEIDTPEDYARAQQLWSA